MKCIKKKYDLETRIEEKLRIKDLLSETKSELHDVEQELQLEELRSAPEYPDAEPRYPDEHTRELSLALEAAYLCEEDLLSRHQDTTSVRDEILDLRRKIREGGQLKAGDFLLGGRFRLIESIGRGGFATVWKASDKKRRCLVAVKVLHGQYAHDKTRRERFFRGARKMSELQHQGIVRVIEEECEDGGYFFFVMEFVAGGDFRQAVLSKRLTLEERLRVIFEVGDALRFAHSNEVVHRDIKPANILLNEAGRPKLTDFDLVRAADTTGGTRTQGMLGTFLYTAPEVLGNPKEANTRSDLFSLGMTAIFAVAEKDLPADVWRDAGSFVEVLDCSSVLKSIMVRSVEWKASERLKSVEEFCRALKDPSAAVAISHTQTLPARCEKAQQLTGIKLVHVPGGWYRLGAEDFENSKPVHRVHLSPFWIGKTAVTNAQYGRFLAENKDRPNPEYWDNPRFNDPQQPVVGVSWSDALAFSRWAGFDLPTEAEWEAAAHGPDERRFPWGNAEPDESLAQFGEDWDSGRPATVGSYPAGAGPFGTLDQAGNVWEWCWDEFDKNAYRHRDGQSDPVIRGDERDENALRVCRGGSWVVPAQDLPAAIRFGSGARNRLGDLGFRVVCRFGPEHGD